MNSNYTGRFNRTLTEAFGAHTSTKIYPMGSDRVKLPRRKMAQVPCRTWSQPSPVLALLSSRWCANERRS